MPCDGFVVLPMVGRLAWLCADRSRARTSWRGGDVLGRLRRGSKPIAAPHRRTGEKYGRQMADAVNQVLAGEMTPIAGKLSTTYAEIDLPFAKLPTRDELASQAASSDKYQAARCQIAAGRDRWRTAPQPDVSLSRSGLRLGDGPVWITLGGEVVVDFALRLEKELPNDRVWIAAYTNDVMAYILAPRLARRGLRRGRRHDLLRTAHHLGSPGRRADHPRSTSPGRQAMTTPMAKP